MSRLAVCASLGILLLAADNPLEGDKFLQKADEKFEQTLTREESYAKAAGEAFETRLKTYRSILAAATKTGDFERATAIKGRIAEIEAERAELGAGAADKKKAAKGPKPPKDAVRFGNHAFLLIKEPTAWHVAKQRCEELGGHLAILRTPEELDFAMNMCKAGGVKSAWVGATDEVSEGKWKWVDGTDAAITGSAIDNRDGLEHYAEAYVDVGFNDTNSYRSPYICEWD